MSLLHTLSTAVNKTYRKSCPHGAYSLMEGDRLSTNKCKLVCRVMISVIEITKQRRGEECWELGVAGLEMTNVGPTRKVAFGQRLKEVKEQATCSLGAECCRQLDSKPKGSRWRCYWPVGRASQWLA